MPFINLPTHRLHYRIDGKAGQPWLVFSNSLGADLGMWDAQIPELGRHFQILRYDNRGHGESTAPPPPYSLAALGNDVIALMDSLEIDRAHFCGLSIGGLTGQWLGRHAGPRFDKLVLCATAAKIGNAQGWNTRIDAVQDHGLGSMTGATGERWFTPGFNAENTDAVASILDTFSAVDPEGYIGCCAALAAADLHEDIPHVSNPVLAISGDDDPVCTPDDLQHVADKVQNGRHLTLPGRHIVNIESAEAFNTALVEFLRG